MYLDYAVSGNVVITITQQAGANAVLSGLFLDPSTSNNTAKTLTIAGVPSTVTAGTTTAGSGIGTYGTQGYDVIGNAASLPGYATNGVATAPTDLGVSGDIPVSGPTKSDSDGSGNLAALDAVLADWTASDSSANAIAEVIKGMGPGNGDTSEPHRHHRGRVSLG